MKTRTFEERRDDPVISIEDIERRVGQAQKRHTAACATAFSAGRIDYDAERDAAWEDYAMWFDVLDRVRDGIDPLIAIMSRE